MVRVLSCVAAAAVAGVSGAAAAETVQISMSLAQAPMGTAGPITGKVTGVDGMVYSNYKVAILTSGDGGNTFWDKSHSPYFLHWQRDPGYDAGNLQNAAVPLNADWSWTIQGYAASPNDATSDLWVAMVVPASFDMRWPQYQIEGEKMRGDLVAAALAYVEVSKSRGQVAAGPGGCACGGNGVPNPGNAINNNAGGAPAPSPSHSAAASPAASPAAPSPAAPAPSQAAPEPSQAAAEPSQAAPAPSQDGAAPASPAASNAAALPAASSSGSPVPSSVQSGGYTSGASTTFPAVMAAGAAAVAGMLLLAQ